MKHRITLSTVAVTVVLLALGLALSPAAQAQRRGRGQGTNGQGQRQAEPDFTLGGDPIALRDPMRSAEADLALRVDVEHELLLDGREQQQVDDVIRQGQQEAMAKERAAIQAMRQQLQANGQNLRNLPLDQRQAATQQVQKQMQDAMVPIRAEEDKAVESALSKQQVARLRQLDLQWRTALALNVPALADQVNLTPEQRQKVASIYQEVTTAQQQAIQSIYGGHSNPANANGAPQGANAGNGDATNPGDGQDTGNGAQSNPSAPSSQSGQTNPPNLDPQTLRDRIQKAQKSADKARKVGAEKVLALLAPDQKAQWSSMIGTPFAFKENSPLSTDSPNY
jgi:hypothetical protein